MLEFTARIGAASTPASPASAMPNPNTGVTHRRTSMPSARVSSGRSVDARTITPTRVFVSTSHTSTDTTIENANTNTWYFG